MSKCMVWKKMLYLNINVVGFLSWKKRSIDRRYSESQDEPLARFAYMSV